MQLKLLLIKFFMEKIKPKSRQIPVGLTDRHREMIEEIQTNTGLYPTVTSVIQRAIVEMYERSGKNK